MSSETRRRMEREAAEEEALEAQRQALFARATRRSPEIDPNYLARKITRDEQLARQRDEED